MDSKEDSNDEETIQQFHEFGLDDRILKVCINLDIFFAIC